MGGDDYEDDDEDWTGGVRKLNNSGGRRMTRQSLHL